MSSMKMVMLPESGFFLLPVSALAKLFRLAWERARVGEHVDASRTEQ